MRITLGSWQNAGPDSVGLWWSLKSHISNKLSGDVDAAGLWINFDYRIDQWFWNFRIRITRVRVEEAVKSRLLGSTPTVSDSVTLTVVLTSSQVMLVLVVWGPHWEHWGRGLTDMRKDCSQKVVAIPWCDMRNRRERGGFSARWHQQDFATNQMQWEGA